MLCGQVLSSSFYVSSTRFCSPRSSPGEVPSIVNWTNPYFPLNTKIRSSPAYLRKKRQILLRGKLDQLIYVMNLSSFGDREDNHCQEDGRAKSTWRETRVFWGFGLFVLSSFLQ